MGVWWINHALIPWEVLKIKKEASRKNTQENKGFMPVHLRQWWRGWNWVWFHKPTKFLLKLFKLEQITKREGNVSISITLDDTYLSQNITYVTCSVKVCEPFPVNALTGIPIGLEWIQSREFCLAFKIILEKDTKTLYQSHFKSFLCGQGIYMRKVWMITSLSK